MARKQYFMQGIKLKKGALRKQMKAKYGTKAFTQRGTIRAEYLDKAIAEGGKLGRRASLAKRMRGWGD